MLTRRCPTGLFIANGILGSAYASQIQAHEDGKRRVVCFLRVMQNGVNVHSRKLQLLNLPAPLALGNLDIISGKLSYLAVTFSVCGVSPDGVQEKLDLRRDDFRQGFPQPAQCRARQWIHVQEWVHGGLDTFYVKVDSERGLALTVCRCVRGRS